MTLGEGKRKVMMLLDEYSSGGEVELDEDIEKKLADFFDLAQKDVAQYCRIVRSAHVELPGGGGSERVSYPMPADCQAVIRVWRDGRIDPRYPTGGRALTAAGSDCSVLDVDYLAMPATIGPDTPDEYEFEVPEEGCSCMPFFVAAQQLLPDLLVDYSAFWTIYLTMRGALTGCVPNSGTGGVRQALFGGRGR